MTHYPGFSRVMSRPADRVRRFSNKLSRTQWVLARRCCKSHGTGRAGSGQEIFKSHGTGRVGSGQEVFKTHGTGRVGSGQEVSNLTGQDGSGRVGSGGFQISRDRTGRVGSGSFQISRDGTGRVGSGQEVFKSRGSGRITPTPSDPCNAPKITQRQHLSLLGVAARRHVGAEAKPPVRPGLHFFFFLTLLLSRFWTSRGHKGRSFSPPGS